MGVYATRWFRRWARRERLPDAALCSAVDEMRRGLVDANMGAGLFKKRVARAGQGKSGGFRTLVATNMADRRVFLYGFAKSARVNIDSAEEAVLKKLALELLSYTATLVSKALEAKQLFELNCYAQDQIPHTRGRP